MVSSRSASFDGTIVNNTITTEINKKTSKGRQKIEIKKIEKKDSRQVTFSKRRTGLFKKAAELCLLTGAKVAILVNSPGGGKVYVFDEYDLIDRYLNDVVETGQLGFPKFDQELVVEEELVDEMDIGKLEEYVSSLEEMKKDALAEADALTMNGNIPALLDLDEMKKDEVTEASDSVVIDNNEAVLDSDLSLDMSCLDSDLLDMSWLDSVSFDSLLDIGDTNDTFNLNFHHGVEV